LTNIVNKYRFRAVLSLNFLQYLAIILIWGSTWLVVKLQVGMPVPVPVSLAIRFGAAGAILLGLCAIHGERLRFRAREHAWLALQGALLCGLNYLIHYFAARSLTSGVVAVIFSTVIVFNMLHGALLFGDRVPLARVLGAVLGLSGVGLVFAQELLALDHGRVTGVGLAFVATLVSSWGMMVSVRNQRAGIPIVAGNAYAMFYSGLLLAGLSLAQGHSLRVEWTPGYFYSMFYLAIFGSIVTFSFYLSLARKIGADRVSYVNLLCPVIALLLSTIFEGYAWTASALGGALCILAGNFLILAGSSRPPVDHEELVERLSRLASDPTQRRHVG
jgi:drug/metabolite transporter (DMT)-like permease